MSDDPARTSGDMVSSSIPRIEPIAQGPVRPFWSVLIPTYNSSDLLEQTLRGVLDQDPGPDRMEIGVVDDCSTNGRAQQIAERLAPGRIGFHRQPVNCGLARNWNTCLALSKGEWIHLIHQDDLILPGFYEAMERAARTQPDLGASFCQHAFIDGDGNWEAISSLERKSPGVIERFLEKLVVFQRIQCPSIVVKRSAYEALGGFNPALCYALDWEMWIRIACRYPIWYEPKVLACYRKHRESTSSHLNRSGEDVADIKQAIEIVSRLVPHELRTHVGSGMYPLLRDQAIAHANELMFARDRRHGIAKFHEAIRYDASLRFSTMRLDYYKWAAKLWFQERLGTQ